MIAELMGKHSNLIFVDGSVRVLAAAKWVPKGKSSRPILPNVQYELPPVMKVGEEAPRSPFLTKLLAALGCEDRSLACARWDSMQALGEPIGELQSLFPKSA